MQTPLSAEPFYKPWIGQAYSDSPHRILILGESHYGDAAKSGDATCELTKSYMSGEMNYAFWTNIQTTVHGGHLSVDERPEFWNAVAFYNYVQRSAGATAGLSPTEDDFTGSRDAFFNTLSRLKPQVILVLSTRLWNHLPGTGANSKAAPPIALDGKTRSAWTYAYDGDRALASWIPHPSIHFSPTKWQPWVKALVDASQSSSI